jgi:hypothetical protein
MKKTKEEVIVQRYLKVLKGIKDVLDTSDEITSTTGLKSILASKKISNDSYLIKMLLENFSVVSNEKGKLKWTGVDPNIKMARKLVDSVRQKRNTVPSLRSQKSITEESIETFEMVSKKENQDPSSFKVPFKMSKMEISIDINSGIIKLALS